MGSQDSIRLLVQEALKAGHRVDDVEETLIALMSDGLNIDKDGLSPLSRVYQRGSRNRLYREWSGTRIDVLDAVLACEVLVPEPTARSTGATFTPPEIADFLARRIVDHLEAAGTLTTARVLDPAVGSGALLIAVLTQIVQRTGQSPFEVARRLYGIDVNRHSARRAQWLIEAQTVSLAGHPGNGAATVVCGDYVGVRQLLSEVTFDAVIANPPYVRYQQMSENQRRGLSNKFESAKSGNFNLYFAFMEKAISGLPDSGVCAFITPSGYLTSASGRALRQWLTQRGAVDAIIDFGDSAVFESASIYTAITFARGGQREQPQVSYARCDGISGIENASKSLGRTKVALPANGAPWVLVPPAGKTAVKRVQRQPVALSDIAEIRYGIATCRDRLYLLSGETVDGHLIARYQSREYPIEWEATRACVKVPDLPDQRSLDRAVSRIIFPYRRERGENAVVWSEDELRTTFPLTAAYFDDIRDELAGRDKGRKTYPAWFAYGRSQGLNTQGPKLLTPLYAKAPRFLFARAPDMLFVNGCSVALRPGSAWQLPAVQAILNSTVFGEFITHVSPSIRGGFHAYQKTQLSSFRCPALTVAQQRELIAADDATRESMIARWYEGTR